MADELKHVGVLGMRWGRRKSQSSSPGSDDHQKVSELKKKKVKELSNADLKAVNTRRLLEKQFTDLNPSTVKQGEIKAKEVMANIGWAVAAAGTIAAAAKIGMNIYSKIPKSGITPDFSI